MAIARRNTVAAIPVSARRRTRRKHFLIAFISQGTGKSQCELANTVKCWGRNNEGQIAVPPDLCDAANKVGSISQDFLQADFFLSLPRQCLHSIVLSRVMSKCFVSQALERAQARVNDTIFETPAPPAKRLPCVCTPEKGCDCLGQYPR